jgi:hypothetical protein
MINFFKNIFGSFEVFQVIQLNEEQIKKMPNEILFKFLEKQIISKESGNMIVIELLKRALEKQ